MEIYRAVPRNGFAADRVHTRHEGTRLPGNVSYLVDNLWELTRPAGLPSRRSAMYASPTPHLALECASADLLSRAEYIACRVVFTRPPRRIFQLSVRDARHHPDVRRLQKLVNEKIRSWPGLESRLVLAPLFLPGVTAPELEQAMQASAQLGAFVGDIAAAVTIWSDQPDRDEGEIIFELDGDTGYTLQPV